MAMGSHARDFQWTTYDKRAPPPLPSLPPWASSAVPVAPVARSIPEEAPGAVAGGWQRPTSYFGALKRLPIQQTPEVHEDDERRGLDERASYNQNQQGQPSGQHDVQPDASDARREWLYSNAEKTALSPTSTNQREEHEPLHPERDSEDHYGEEPLTPPDELATPGVAPLSSQGAYFRPWKKNQDTDLENSATVDGDDSVGTANKWKVRALANPFARRKGHQAARPTQHGVTAPEPPPPAACDPVEEDPAEPSPPTHLARAPPRRSAAVRRSDANSAPTAPLRPATPVLTSAPIAVLHPEPPQPSQATTPQYEKPVSSAGSLHRPLRPLRLRETKHLPQLSPVPVTVNREDEELPPALGSSLSDLRRSTALLAPLAGGATEPPLLRPIQDAEDDVVKVLTSVPRKPPTQLQQLKQQHQQQKKGKKSTLDALNEIKRKREERRNAQAEEKQRVKAELEQHGDDAGYKFRRLIQKHRDGLPAHQKPGQQVNRSGAVASSSNARLSVFVRKRPLAKKELKAKGYDIITCLFPGRTATAIRSELVCHEPKLKVDCSESLENHQFHFDGVFDDEQDNTAVYTATVGPMVPFLVQPVSSSSASAATSLTVFAYGQTGSGKTYTMKSIYRQAASDLFERLGSASVTVGVSFYEIYMNQVNDLLNMRTRVQLMEDGDGVVQLLGLKEISIASADELMEAIAIGEEARATSANAVHDDSSRSHALLRVTIYSSNSNQSVLARLSMVDLAGSERACDTQSDSKSTRMEGAEINKSLLALKECIRALDRGATHIPFRQSKLTQLLRDSFLCANSKTVMIATVSPWSESCNHTLNTLRYADRLKEIGSS